MVNREVKRWTLSCLFAIALAMPQWVVAQTTPKSIVVFGDSLSDSGNAFALLGTTNTPPDYSVDPFLVPDRPYARGGLHFSNGATWIEQLARSLALAGNARPALRSSSPTAANYAVGGARARDDHVSFNLPQEVSTFLSDRGGVAPSDALYILEIGGNDVRDALVAFVGTLQAGGTPAQAQAAAQAVLADAVASIGAQMQALGGAGARQFLVWRVPSIGLTPAIRSLASVNPALPFVGDSLTQAFNAAVEANVLAPLQAAGFGIVRFDAYQLLAQVVAQPADFGLTDVTHACITPAVAPFECQHPDEFLFWDGIHPTAAGHAIIAQRASSLLTH